MKKLLFVFSVVVLLAVGCNSSKQSNLSTVPTSVIQNTPTNNTPTPTQTANSATQNVASSTTTPSPTANWQTYTDNSMGINIKFPKEWNIIYPATTPGFFQLSTVSDKEFNISATLNKVNFRINLVAFQNTLPIDQWYSQYFNGQLLKGIVSKDDTTLAGLPAIEAHTLNNYNGSPYAEVHYFVARGGHVFHLDIKDDDPNYAGIYQTILNNISFFPISNPNGNFSVSSANIFPHTITSSQVDQKFWRNDYNWATVAAGGLSAAIDSLEQDGVLSREDGLVLFVLLAVAKTLGPDLNFLRQTILTGMFDSDEATSKLSSIGLDQNISGFLQKIMPRLKK